MGDVVSLSAHREKQLAREHARGLVLFECAAALARRGDPALVALIEETFGADFLDQRVSETLRPHRPEAPRTSSKAR